MAVDMKRIAVYAHTLDSTMHDIERAHLLCGDVADWIKVYIDKEGDNDAELLYRSVRILELLEENLDNAGTFLRDQVSAARKDAAPQLEAAQGVAA